MLIPQLRETENCLLSDGISFESLKEASHLLQKNHDEWHMFFRDRAGHNHIAHSILTSLALGASPTDLQRAYDDGTTIQRPMPPADEAIISSLADDDAFARSMGDVAQYPNFLRFFERQILEGSFQTVVNKYCFSRSKVAEMMLARLYEGAYHPIIHLGLGLEFDQPSIVAEALAQAAAHDDSHIGLLFSQSESLASIAYPARDQKPLVELLDEVRCNDTIRSAPVWEDFGNKMRDGVIGRAGAEMAGIASQFSISSPEDLERRTAEMINVAAYFAGASQRPGRKRKVDFFYMHAVTSSIFFSTLIKQSWIKLEDRIRLVEWKGRLDLAWYAVCGCPVLYPEAIAEYCGAKTNDSQWDDIFSAAVQQHDDGHLVKFLRALKNGESVSKPFENGKWSKHFPMKGDMWLRLARMCLDTTRDLPDHLKWLPFTGFDMGWKVRPDLA
nr:questin oxidase [Quercus suber]